MALGAPYGLEMSASAGIVSAKNRTLGTQFVPFIQTDAAVNPGNSGGPLFNAKGEVIGITSQIYSKSGGFAGLSFAIPIDIAARVARDLIDDGKVTRGKIGVSLQPVTDEMAQAFGLPHEQGALITFIDEKGPGKAAGLQVGDIILKADGHVLLESLDLPRYVTSVSPGAPVKLTTWRGGKQVELSVKVAPMEDEKVAQAQGTPAAGGVRVSLQPRPLLTGRTHRQQAAETTTRRFPGSSDLQPSERRSEGGLAAARGFDFAGQNSQGMGQVGRRACDRQTPKPTLGSIESRSAGHPQRSNPPPVL